MAINEDQTGGSIAAYSFDKPWYMSNLEGGVISNASIFDISFFFNCDYR